MHYLLRIDSFFKKVYHKHPLIIKIIFGIIFIGIASFLIIYFFTFKKWCEIVAATILMGLLIWIWKILKAAYVKYIKKDKNDKTNK